MSNSDKLWYDDLISKYPNVFRNLSYLECNEGWKNIIEAVSSSIEDYINTEVPDELKEGIFATQVKEKFGGLRFYMSDSFPYINGAIHIAEKLSFKTCEVCGSPSVKTPPVKRYIQTLCQMCYNRTQK